MERKKHVVGGGFSCASAPIDTDGTMLQYAVSGHHVGQPCSHREEDTMSPHYQQILTLEPGKRGGKPTIRGLRITVYDVLSYLAAGMTMQEVLDDFPYLTHDDILA